MYELTFEPKTIDKLSDYGGLVLQFTLLTTGFSVMLSEYVYFHPYVHERVNLYNTILSAK